MRQIGSAQFQELQITSCAMEVLVLQRCRAKRERGELGRRAAIWLSAVPDRVATRDIRSLGMRDR